MGAPTNTTVAKGRFIDITFGESGSSGADWTMTGDYESTGFLHVKSIQFYPSAANDIIVIQDSTDGTDLDGPLIWIYKAAALTGEHMKYFDPPERMRPTIDVSDCTFGATGTARLVFNIA